MSEPLSLDNQIAALRTRIDSLETLIGLVPIKPRALARYSGIASIVVLAAELWEVTPQEIISDRRTASFMVPRFAVSWVARQTLPHSLPMIGRALGGRDHSTIMNHLRRADRLRQRDASFRARTDRMAAIIERAIAVREAQIEEPIDA